MRWAESYLSIPFRDRGDDRKGCDCWGLIRLVYREQLGIDLPAYENVGTGQDVEKIEQILEGHSGPEWKEISSGDEKAFDGILMKGLIRVKGKAHMGEIHMGIVVEPGKILHIEHGKNVTIGNYISDRRLKHRIVGFFRYEPDPGYI